MTQPLSGSAHTVMACWSMNDPGNKENLQELADAIEAQSRIPGVMSVSHGPRTAQVDWEGPDKAFDYAMLVSFADIGSARAYPAHPLHQQLIGSIYYVGDGEIRWFWMDC